MNRLAVKQGILLDPLTERPTASLDQLGTLVSEFVEDYQLDADRKWERVRCMPGMTPRTAIHLDDLSGIPNTSGVTGLAQYQLRSRVRAKTDDVYVATTPFDADYERYNDEYLGLGAPRFIQVAPIDDGWDLAGACMQPAALATLAAIARARQGLALHPYMGMASVWSLAAALADCSGVPISVIAPTPAVTDLANDKWAMTRLAEGLLGKAWVVPTIAASTPQELAAGLRSLARTHSQVALKMVSCASGMGLQRWDSSAVRQWSVESGVRIVSDFLTDNQCQPDEVVMAMVWEASVRCSPSVQLWIPPMGSGRVRVDGVYQQILDDAFVFLGSTPAQFKPTITRSLEWASLAMGNALQRLGYVGRCSFDFLLMNDGGMRFIECNARWGGTSTPMHLVDRVFPARRPWYIATDVIRSTLKGATFADLAARFGDRLYNHRTKTGQYILYNIGCLYEHGKFDVVVLGSDAAEAHRRACEELPSLLI